jgi:hypothetical protein
LARLEKTTNRPSSLIQGATESPFPPGGKARDEFRAEISCGGLAHKEEAETRRTPAMIAKKCRFALVRSEPINIFIRAAFPLSISGWVDIFPKILELMYLIYI